MIATTTTRKPFSGVRKGARVVTAFGTVGTVAKVFYEGGVRVAVIAWETYGPGSPVVMNTTRVRGLRVA